MAAAAAANNPPTRCASQALGNAYKLIDYRARTNLRYIDRGVFLGGKIKEAAIDLTRLVEEGGGLTVFDKAAEMPTINSTITVSNAKDQIAGHKRV
jgi:hypothetical protein